MPITIQIWFDSRQTSSASTTSHNLTWLAPRRPLITKACRNYKISIDGVAHVSWITITSVQHSTISHFRILKVTVQSWQQHLLVQNNYKNLACRPSSKENSSRPSSTHHQLILSHHEARLMFIADSSRCRSTLQLRFVRKPYSKIKSRSSESNSRRSSQNLIRNEEKYNHRVAIERHFRRPPS